MGENKEIKQNIQRNNRFPFLKLKLLIFLFGFAAIAGLIFAHEPVRRFLLGEQDKEKYSRVNQLEHHAADQIKVLAENSEQFSGEESSNVESANAQASIKSEALAIQSSYPLTAPAKDIPVHFIRQSHINTNAITSRTIRDRSIRSRDLDKELSIRNLTVDEKLKVEDISADDIVTGTITVRDSANLPATVTTQITSNTLKTSTANISNILSNSNLQIKGRLPKEDVMTITDFTDLFLYPSGLTAIGVDVVPALAHLISAEQKANSLYVKNNLEVGGIIYGTFAGGYTPSGNLDMAGNLITNIGAVGTDFTSGGGLNVAGDLNVNDKLYVNATNGYVGIGTTNPSEKLQVSTGNVYISGSNDVEILSETDFNTHNNWNVAGDFDDSTGGAVYLSNTGTGLLSQPLANFASAPVGSKRYEFTYTISAIAWEGTMDAVITSSFATVDTALDLTEGTHTVSFVTAAAPGDFVISVTSDTPGDGFMLDDVSLKRVIGGNLIAVDGLITGGGDTGIKITPTGSVGIGTVNPSTKFYVVGGASTFGLTNSNSLGGIRIPTNNTFLAFRQSSSGGFSNSTEGWQMNITSNAHRRLFMHNTTSGRTLGLSVQGTVGIGVGLPGSKLEVFGTSNSTSLTTFVSDRTLSIVNSDTTANNLSTLAFRTFDAGGTRLSGAEISAIYTDHQTGSVDADLAFLSRQDGILAEKMRILNSGNVGVGTTVPSTKLHIVSGSDGNTATISDTDGTCVLDPESGGAWSCSSDENLKKEINPLQNSLNLIMALNPVSFRMRVNNSLNYGFIAQEIQKVYPHAVSQLPDGYLGVAEGKLIPHIIGAIQEQQTEISGQQTMTTAQQQLITQLNSYDLSNEEKIKLLVINMEDLSSELEKIDAQQVKDNRLLSQQISQTSQTIDSLNQLTGQIVMQLDDHESRIETLEKWIPATDGMTEPLQGVIKEFADILQYTTDDGTPIFTIDGDVKVAGDFDVAENLKLNEKISGSGEISAGATFLKIPSSVVKKTSKIYVTPTGSTYGKILYVSKDDITQEDSFIVKFDGDPAEKAISFDWLIVN